MLACPSKSNQPQALVFLTSALQSSAERPDVSYSLVAVDFLPDQAINSSLRRLAANLSRGALQPLPAVVHNLASVQAALRQMSQARHVGKIVVRSPTLQQHHEGTDQVGVNLPFPCFHLSQEHISPPW